MNAVEIQGLTKRYGAITAVDSLDLTVRQGGRFVFGYNSKAPGKFPRGLALYFFPFTTNPVNPAAFSFSSILSALARTAKAPTWTRYRVSL